MWRMAKTGKRSIFVVISESKQEGDLFYLHCKPMGDYNHCSGFLFLFIHCAGLWCVRHCTNTPGAWILVPECWQPKSTVQVFHLQNSSLQMLTCKSCREPGIALQAGKLQHGDLNGLPKTVEKISFKTGGENSRRYCQNKTHASIPLISVRKWI